MVAMAVSVTAIFFNSLWGIPRLFFDTIRSVGSANCERAGAADGLKSLTARLTLEYTPGCRTPPERLDVHHR
jgi:hypothetical protein